MVKGGEEALSPDRGPLVQTPGSLGFSSAPPSASLGTLDNFLPRWAAELANLNVITPAGFCPYTPSSPPCEKPRWCSSHKDILPSSGIPRDSLVGSQLDEGRGSGPDGAFPGPRGLWEMGEA